MAVHEAVRGRRAISARVVALMWAPVGFWKSPAAQASSVPWMRTASARRALAYRRAGHREIVERNVTLAARLGRGHRRAGRAAASGPVRLNVVCFTLTDEPIQARVGAPAHAVAGSGKPSRLKPTVHVAGAAGGVQQLAYVRSPMSRNATVPGEARAPTSPGLASSAVTATRGTATSPTCTVR